MHLRLWAEALDTMYIWDQNYHTHIFYAVTKHWYTKWGIVLLFKKKYLSLVTGCYPPPPPKNSDGSI